MQRSGRGRVSRRNAEFFKDVVGAFGEFGALFDECVATFGERRMDRPRYRTSCPCSAAARAVINEPLAAAASTTGIPAPDR